jgi:septum site-determining protein MinC
MSEPSQRAAAAPSKSRDAAGSRAFEIKGSVFTLSVLHLLTNEMQAIAAELRARSPQAVEFFRNAPIVLDLHVLEESGVALDFATLLPLLREHHLVPVGVRNVRHAHQDAALAAGLGLLPGARQAREPSQTTSEPKEPPPPAIHASKTITQPVRSGQQIYAQGGDLVVVAAVSAGAEILADGHIHVYGPLRGRALAGIKGDVHARIFCHALEAELVSVAGNYRVIENLGEQAWGQPAQVYLADNRLLIEPL